MSIKAGQWWKCRDGKRAYIHGVTRNETFPLLGELANGIADSWTKDGAFKLNGDSDYDLVEHLPWCKSWDDEEPKPIDPGEGWRLLEPSEPKLKGDMFLNPDNPHHDWEESSLGPKERGFLYRRRIEPKPIEPPAGYRLLAHYERKMDDDLYYDDGKWKRVFPSGFLTMSVAYARRIEPKFVPWTIETWCNHESN